MGEKFPWAMNLEELVGEYDTDLQNGLSTPQIETHLARFGPNELPSPPKSFLRIYLAPLFNWLIMIYLVASIILLIVGQITGEGNMGTIYITLAVVAINCGVAILQQARATKKLRALRELASPSTKVIRDGQVQEIFSKNLVVGDLLALETGDRIPADCRIITSSNLQVNEASLTGESEAVRKNEGEPLKNIPLHLQNQENVLFYGTFVTTGHAHAIVFAVGVSTEIGKISQGLEESGQTEIPIQKKLNHIGKWFGIGVIGAWLLVLFLLYLSTGEVQIVKSLLSAMDIMPINIPLLTTIIMITGTLGMAEHGVIIRNLTSVDSLGRVSVVCSDKTGTLTKSQMSVQHIWARGSHFEVSGCGYDPKGEIFLMDNPQQPLKVDDLDDFPHLKLLLMSGYLNNNASLIKHQFQVGKRVLSDWKIIGNPTEGALLTLAAKAGLSSPTGKKACSELQMVKEFPFSSASKRMTKVFRRPDGKYLVFSKGASEILITTCSDLLAEEGASVEFIIEMRLVIMNSINEFATQGFRILSFAYKILDEMPTASDPDKSRADQEEEIRDALESDLVYIGFVAIMDPPRENAKAAVELCRQAGVEVVMITGDSLPTAKAIASQISIIKSPKDRILEGNDIDSIQSTQELRQTKVFSRVSPSHKQQIIEKYRAAGQVVAMTGDGVNDALALNMADVGIAMGIQGTDVAKEASDMILSDDAFESIVEGIHRGRGIFANIRSVVFFFISINLFEGIVQFLLAVVLQKPYFLDDAFYFQWVFLALSLHMFPGFILTFDTISKDVMREKPRDSQEIISREVLVLMAIYGVLLMGTMLLTYFLVYSWNYPLFSGNTSFGALNGRYLFTEATMDLTPGMNLRHAKTLTMLMVSLYFCEGFLALQIRRPNMSLWKSLRDEGNPIVFIIIGLLFASFLAIMYIPGFQLWLMGFGLAFNFMTLTLVDWLVCMGLSVFGCILPFEAVKWAARRHKIVF